MLICERCRQNVASGMYRCVMTEVYRFGEKVRPPDEFRALCGNCGLGGDVYRDRTVYRTTLTQGTKKEELVGSVPKVERIELMRSVNLV
jgi:hypothetical protein